MRYRVFTAHLGWSESMYIFDERTSFRELKNNPQTRILGKANCLGTYDFDDRFLMYFEKKQIGEYFYYVKNSYYYG